MCSCQSSYIQLPTPPPSQRFAAFPSPGEYFLEVKNVVEVPGGLTLKVDGLSHPLALRLVLSDEVLRVKVG